ncbi:MAG: hypothetical protein V1820_01450 [archaeon]
MKIPTGKILILLIAVFAFVSGSLVTQEHGLWPDEALYMGATRNFFSGNGLTLGGEGGVFPALPILSAAFMALTGTGFSKLPFYLATVLAAIFALAGTYSLARKLLDSKEAAILSTAVMATNATFLFYSTRILLDVYDAAVSAIGLLAIFSWQEEPTSMKKAALAGAAIAAAYFVRVPDALVLLVAFGVSAALALFKNSSQRKGTLVSVICAAAIFTVPVLTWIALAKSSVLGFYSVVNFSGAGAVVSRTIFQVPSAFEFVCGGIVPALAAIIGLLLLARSQFFLPIAAFTIAVTASRLPVEPYDARYLLSILPLLAIAIIAAPLKISQAISQIPKGVAKLAIPAVFVVALSIYTLSFGLAMFEAKKGGYLEIEYSAEWMKKNVPEGEPVYAGAYRIVGLLSGHLVIALPLNEAELLSNLSIGTARYIEIDNYDWAQPQYALGLLQKYPANFSIEKQFVSKATGGGSVVVKYVGS